MRFINTKSLCFQDVADSDLSELENGYCILSHRWGEGEILYDDVLHFREDVKAKAGYGKYVNACAQAKALDFDLIWIDTCCITKVDSVELGEAINSMYRWYANSRICIAYLEDIESTDAIASSEWFDRGWTLQEMIAPKDVRFFSGKWVLLGDKQSLSKVLTDRTGVPIDVLKNERPPQDFSVAQRMSWASKRKTKRVEDQAYCLMGLFSVNMPMICGEREQAFTRLQEHIITKSADESIFAWNFEHSAESTNLVSADYCGPLAPSPAHFEGCNDIVTFGESMGFSIGQLGLSIKLPVIQFGFHIEGAYLNATNIRLKTRCIVLLAKIPNTRSYVRIKGHPRDCYRIHPVGITVDKSLNIALNPTKPPLDLYPGFWIRTINFPDDKFPEAKVMSIGESNETDRLRLPDGRLSTAGVLEFTYAIEGSKDYHCFLKLGFDSDSLPICHVAYGIGWVHRIFEAARLEPAGATGRAIPAILDDRWTEIARLYTSQNSGGSGSSHKTNTALANVSFDCSYPNGRINVVANRLPDRDPSRAQLMLDSQVWTLDISLKTLYASQDPEASGSSWCC